MQRASSPYLTALTTTLGLSLATMPQLAFAEAGGGEPYTCEETTFLPVDGAPDMIIDSEGQPLFYSEFTLDPMIFISPDLLCPQGELFFDGECRTQSWLQATFSQGNAVAFGGSPYMGGSGTRYLMVMEQNSSDVIEHYLIADDYVAAPNGFFSVSIASRGGYRLESMFRQTLMSQPDSTFTVHVESFEPVTDPLGWYWESLDWRSTTYQPGSNPVYCTEDGCISAFSSKTYTCKELAESVESQTFNDCMFFGTGMFLTASMTGIGAGTGIIAFLLLTGGSAGAGAPVAAGVGVSLFLGIGAAGAGAATWWCENEGTQAAFRAQTDAGCFDPEDPEDPEEPEDPDDEDDGVAELTGCKECDDYGTNEYTSSHWDNGTGTLDVTCHSEIVCESWTYHPDGTDSNGDGWCD